MTSHCADDVDDVVGEHNDCYWRCCWIQSLTPSLSCVFNNCGGIVDLKALEPDAGLPLNVWEKVREVQYKGLIELHIAVR